MTPEFPLRILLDDGECQVISSPDELIREVVSLDSTDPRNRVWVRDALDRTVLVRVRGGWVEKLELA